MEVSQRCCKKTWESLQPAGSSPNYGTHLSHKSPLWKGLLSLFRSEACCSIDYYNSALIGLLWSTRTDDSQPPGSTASIINTAVLAFALLCSFTLGSTGYTPARLYTFPMILSFQKYLFPCPEGSRPHNQQTILKLALYWPRYGPCSTFP